MTEQASKMLESIDNFLATADSQSVAALWSVLTALRGPDWTNDPSDSRKMATTAVIRQVAFPRTAARNNKMGAFFEEDRPEYEDVRCGLIEKIDSPRHFVGHAMDAFNVLGIKW